MQESVAHVDFDPLAKDPVADLDALLAAGHRVVRSPRMRGAYLVLTRREAEEVLTDTATYSSAYALGGPVAAGLPEEIAAQLPGFLREPVSGVVDADAPEHGRLRATVQRAYAGPRVNPLAPRVTGLAEELAAALARHERPDLVEHYALPLVHGVMGLAMGVPRDMVEQVAAWAQDMAALITPDTPLPDKSRAAGRLREYEEWARGFLAALPDGHEGALGVYAHGDPAAGAEPFTVANQLNNMLVHWVAGTVTTCHTITTAAHLLLTDRALWEQAVADPETVTARALEEGLRYAAPHRGLVRVTTRRTTLGGTDLPAGAQVLPILSAANRDPEAVPEPARFDPHRDSVRDHLAFGTGAHACVGAHLARMEGRVALTTLVRRHPGLRPADPDSPPPLLPNYFFHGIAHLPVTGLTARSATDDAS
ncbi:cytochrome P450 [Streptomyces albus subsp. chlorinus]|uniref:cytochrome P450 n=1 Tax=Streptomyces albus TaxID=1888 RepID=UPI001570C2E7|nr:cytochrome P450 [Streptomyces albus]NSC20183.1 cytochrome P450 [Streptomyces albus subsp. chlorinus]